MKERHYSFPVNSCKHLMTAGVIGGLLACAAQPMEAAPYQDAVLNLSPSYYYQLNETSIAGGAIDSTGHAVGPGSYNGDYVNGPAMVGGPGPLEVFGGIPVPGVGGAANVAHFSNNEGHIILGDGAAYGANDMTVAFFMKAGPSQGGDRLFSNNLTDPTKSLQIDCGNNGLVIAVDPAKTGVDAERTLYLEDNSGPDRRLIDANNGWFHIVASTRGATGPERASNFKIWINGVNRTANLRPDVVGWGVETGLAKIGGRGADPKAPQTHSGAQDEMAIWLNRVLTDEEVASVWAAARRGSMAGLSGWWPFDGDAGDRSGRGLNGTVLGGAGFDAEKPASLSGQSVRFNVDADGVRVSANSALNVDEFTLGYYINLQGAAQGHSGLERLSARTGFAFETAVGDAHAVGGTTSPSGLTLSYYSPSINWTATQVEVPADGWVHVAWHNTAAGMELFLNGVSAYSGPAVPAGALGGPMTFGTRFDQTEGFQGLMDDAFLWDGSLTAAEIASIAAKGIGAHIGFATDSDGDGLPDWWEIQNGLNAGDNGSVSAANGPNGDPDNDGLTNAQEYAHNTKARVNDTDNDGLQDGAEVTRGTNPLVADTDGDGLTDGDEITRGTDPTKADTDGDTVNDGEEVKLGTNPLDPLSGPPPSAFLVLHLKLDGDAQDSSPLANHGVLRGSPEFVADTVLTGGQALALSANDMGVEVAENDSLAANAFTLAYWVKPTAAQEGTFDRLTSRAGYAFETAVGSRDAGPLTLSYYQTTGWYSTGTGLPMNEYTHVAWRNRGSGSKDLDLFINGKLVFTGLGVPASGPGSGLMSIGNAYNGIEGFQGIIDDVRLYRAPLKDSDIAVIATPTDTDGDGLPDYWEVQNDLNPADNGSVNVANGAAGDPDSDGLTNAQEYAHRTKAKVADTDGDGVQDGAEVTRGSDPTKADTDGDGLTDGDEIKRGTDPTKADTDGDTIADGLEIEMGTNPLDPLSGPPASSFLVLHLKLDGDTQDSSPLANHGMLLGAPEFVTDNPLGSGQAISFTSNDSGVSVAGSDSLAANTFTLCYWAKPTTLQEGAGLERFTSRSGDQFETAIGNAQAIGGTVDLTLSYYQGGAWTRTGITLALDEWAHVAWRNRGSGPQDLDLFVNGRLVFSGLGVPPGGPGNGLMNIGNRYSGIEGFEGLMDDVRLYRAPLKNSDIAALVGLSFTKIVRAADGASVTLAFTSRPDQIYAVEYSTDLGAGSWTTLTDKLASGGAETIYVDTTASKLPYVYYRARTVKP